MYPNEHQERLDDDLEPFFSILTAGTADSHPVFYLQTVENALTGVMECTTTIDISRKEWLDMTWRIDSLRTLLRDYHRDLQRAARVPGHRCISPCNDHAGVPRVPDYFVPCLKELCRTMKHVILLVQKCRDTLAQTLCDLSLQDEIQQCCSGVHTLLGSIKACLSPKKICCGPLDVLSRFHKPIPIMKRATPRRYRLVDCSEVMSDTICIKEFIHFPHVPYATVSYVWRGNNDPIEHEAAKFSIEGTERADPIAVDVLRDACKAAIARGATHLFIDRLCVMQTDEEDKNWQIREMHDIYRSCVTCIVLPGGLRRLVHVSEETLWIHRVWTLQEAIVPPSVSVLVAWKLGKGSVRVHDVDDHACDVEEITRGKSAMMPLSVFLKACAAGHLLFEWKKQFKQIETRLFDTKPHGKSDSSSKTSSQPDQRILLPNIAALMIAMSKDTTADQRQYAIWQSAFMRSSSRPVDMIFSIMGLFGIFLDTRAFKDNDRTGATIALAQEILKKGGHANWLGISLQIVPCKHLSIFPDFPFPFGPGKAIMRDKDGKFRSAAALMETEYPFADVTTPMPHGSIDDDGYFTFNAKATRVITDPGGWIKFLLALETYTALDGSSWTTYREGMIAKPTFAVLLGTFSKFRVSDKLSSGSRTSVRAMLVEEHATGKFHVRSYFRLTGKSAEWVNGWTICNFRVGGPETSSRLTSR